MKIVFFAGGVGTRLWPLSRKNTPKQFEQIVGNSSTLQLSVDRLTSSLQSRLISQLLADVGNGNTGQLITDDFILNIVDDSGALLIQIVDKATGETSEIQVSGLTPD